MELTQIQISKETRTDLKKLRLTQRESYEEIIKRLIENVETNKDSQSTKDYGILTAKKRRKKKHI